MRNRLMSALTESDYCAVLARMRPISVDTGTRLLRREQLGFCLFIETGFAGVCYSPDKGQPVSVGVIGEDGMLGISAVLGVDSIDYSAVALTPFHAFAIRPSDLRPLLSERPSLQLVLLGYAHRRLTEMMRMAACYARHSLEQRLAGCLLRLADLGRNLSVPLTHQQLGLLLSVTRPSVTLAMRQLEDEGAVTCRRNLIEIRDREALSRLTCGCQLLSNSNGKISVHVHSTLNRPSAAARPVAPPTSQADGVHQH
jgi:CRP-like cAMP-binding protein